MSAGDGPKGGQSTTNDDDSERELFEALKAKGRQHLCDALAILVYLEGVIQLLFSFFLMLCLRHAKILSRASGPWRLLGRNVG